MERNVIIKKEDGRIIMLPYDEELANLIRKSGTNPCSECKNCSELKCPKLYDENKKDIRKYDFISTGYQINDENGMFDTLIVSKCNNFVKEAKRNVKRERQSDAQLELIAAERKQRAVEIQRLQIAKGLISGIYAQDDESNTYKRSYR